MKGIYLYNKGTKALHIDGFCHNSNSPEYERFSSETDAIKYAGGQIYLCKDCETERDKVLEENISKRSAKR